MSSTFLNFVLLSGTKTRFETAAAINTGRYAQCRGKDSVLRTLAHLLAAHPHATPKQAKEPSLATQIDYQKNINRHSAERLAKRLKLRFK